MGNQMVFPQIPRRAVIGCGISFGTKNYIFEEQLKLGLV